MDNLDVLVPNPIPKDKPRRETFVSSELEMPNLVKADSDTKLSKNGTNIFVRFRPIKFMNELEGEDNINYSSDLRSIQINNEIFKYKRIFPSSTTQNQIFLSVGIPLIEVILEGYNCGLLAYGQTGSGKTYTLLEDENIWVKDDKGNLVMARKEPQKKGIIPRLLETVFHEIQLTISSEIIYTVYASLIEIYSEKINDLLNPSKRNLKIFQDLSKGIWATDATNVPVKNSNEILKQLEFGLRNRVTERTNSNPCSSRSHAILILTINKKIVKKGSIITSQVYFVDLCGSERINKTGVIEDRLVEAQKINKSLLALSNVISALVENKKHIPYRDSKLTTLLQNCFGGTSIASLILCCSPSSFNLSETLSTLRFGDRAIRVKNKPIKNIEDTEEENQRLLNDANCKIFNQEKVIRTQMEKINEMENYIREIMKYCNGEKFDEFRAKYKISFKKKKKSVFETIGLYPFIIIFTFVGPLDCLSLVFVSRLFEKRLKSDLLWSNYIDMIKQGKLDFYGLNEQALVNVKSNIYNFIREIYLMRTEKTLSVKHGMTLFINKKTK